MDPLGSQEEMRHFIAVYAYASCRNMQNLTIRKKIKSVAMHRHVPAYRQSNFFHKAIEIVKITPFEMQKPDAQKEQLELNAGEQTHHLENV